MTQIPEVFEPFVAATKESFGYLDTDYGFRLISTGSSGPGAWVTYENETTRVTVNWELGSAPWVEIGRLEVRGNALVQPASIGLHLVLRERGRPLLDELDVPRDLSTAEITEMTRTRAVALHEFGRDLLCGDFSAFPRLQKKAERELRDREADVFGAK